MSELIGFYGGTFSPPHKGHIHAAKVFIEAVGLTKLLIIPTATPPHKARVDGATDEDRIAMCRLAFADLPHTEISTLEFERGGRSFTADTIARLTVNGDRVAMLIGTDMFLTLDTWHDPAYIFKHADIYCIRREDDVNVTNEILQKNAEYKRIYGKEVVMLKSDAILSASSDIRASLRNGKSSDLLTEDVATYISERGLYR